MKTFIVGGQSTAYGLDIVKPAGVKLSKDEYRSQSCFWYPVFKELGFDNYVNVSTPGDSNDAVFRKIVDEVIAAKERGDDDIFVLACVVAGELFEVFDNNTNGFKNIIFTQSSQIVNAMEQKSESLFSKRSSPELKLLLQTYSDNFLNVEHSLTRFFLHVISMQSFFKQQGVRYKFVHSSSPALQQPWDVIHDHPVTQKYRHLIDTTHFIDFLSDDVMNITLANSAKVGRFFHPLEDGHKFYGDYLVKKLKA